MPTNQPRTLEKYRQSIASRVRELRLDRRWTQAELASELGVSQGRLSELERGDGSFSAEQLLVLLRTFNVTIADVVAERPEPQAALQNALARLGAGHLVESQDVLPEDGRDDPERVIREALATGSPRLVTALAPVLVKNAERVNMVKLRSALADIGIQRRLEWLLDSTLEALAIEQRDAQLPRAVAQSYRRVRTAFELHRAFVPPPGSADGPDGTPLPPLDLLDPQIRSKATVDELVASASPLAKRWRIVTALTAQDFANALRASRVPV